MAEEVGPILCKLFSSYAMLIVVVSHSSTDMQSTGEVYLEEDYNRTPPDDPMTYEEEQRLIKEAKKRWLKAREGMREGKDGVQEEGKDMDLG